LRFVTGQENSRNSSLSKNNTSKIKGVYFHKRVNKWNARIMINWKLIHIGCFSDIEDAKQARQAKAKELFGDYVNSCEL
jgi:hypothetical protein